MNIEVKKDLQRYTVFLLYWAAVILIAILLSASGSEYLNPEMLIKAAKEKGLILGGNPAEEHYSILRTHVYLADGETEFR